MRKEIFSILLTSVLVSSNLSYAKKNEFNHVSIFGDSLSDAGSDGSTSRYIAGGPSTKGYFDYLSKYYADKPSTYVKNGGTNYAIAASLAHNISDQVNLAIDQETDIKNNLYVLWAGGSDVNVAIIKNIIPLLFSQYNLQKNELTLVREGEINPIQDITQSAQKLIDAGARLVVIPNIPDTSMSPITSMFHIDISLTTIAAFLPPPINQVFSVETRRILGHFLDDMVRKNIAQGHGPEYIRNYGINALSNQIPFVPKFLIESVYDFFVKIQRNIIKQFNFSEEQALQKLDNRIVYADVNELFLEIINDPDFFGIDSVVLTACSLSYRSSDCSAEQGNYDTDNTYLFGDWFHPSGFTHLIIADYIQSIIDAPVYVASIYRHLDAIDSSTQRYLNNQLLSLLNEPNKEIKKWIPFAGYSGVVSIPNLYVETHNNFIHNANFGIYNRISDQFLIGALFNGSYGKKEPHQSFKYRYNAQNLALFSQWLINDNFWLNTNFSVGRLKASHIERNIKLGNGIRTESSDNTTALSWGVHAKTGWNLFKSEENNFLSGPFFALNHTHYKVDGTTEKGTQSTSMRFDKYKHDKTYASLGWFVNTQDYIVKDKPINFNLEASYNQSFSKDPITIKSGLKRTKLSFNREINPEADKWIDLNSNMNIRYSDKTNIHLGLGFKIDNEKSKEIHYSIGLKHKF